MSSSTNLTEEERIIRAKIELNDTHPFFSYILMNMIIKEEPSVPTMGVDRRGHLYYNKEFVSKLPSDQLRGVLAHEAMHMATLTFRRQGYRQMQLWNIATDYIINYIITKEGIKLPPGGLMSDTNGDVTIPLKGGRKLQFNLSQMTAEEVYDRFEQEMEKMNMSGEYGDGGEGLGSKQFDKHFPGKGDPDKDGDEDSEGKSGAHGDDLTDAEKADLDNKWKDKCAEASTSAKMRGKMGSTLQRMVDQVLEPVVDWRSKLYHFITRDLPTDFTMRRPGRRFHTSGIYTPIVLKERLKVEIGIDVSGSISQKELQDFAAEVLGICKGFPQVEARVFWWSTSITDENELVLGRNAKPADFLKHKFDSTGGTHMSCIKPYFERKMKKPAICIILTDGYVESEPDIPQGPKYMFVISKGGITDHVKHLGDTVSLGNRKDD